MAFLGREVKNQLLSGENTHKVLLLGNQWNKKRKRNCGLAGCRSRPHLLCIYGDPAFCMGRRRRRAGAQSHDRKLINTKISCLIWFGTSLFRDSESTISYV